MTDQTRIDLDISVRRSPRVGGITINEQGEYVDPTPPTPKTPFVNQWADAQAKVLWKGFQIFIALAIVFMFGVIAIFVGGVFGGD